MTLPRKEILSIIWRPSRCCNGNTAIFKKKQYIEFPCKAGIQVDFGF